MLQIVEKYNLSGDSVLRHWLKWYNTPKWKLKIGEFMAREKISKDKKLQLVLQYINKENNAKEIASNKILSLKDNLEIESENIKFMVFVE